MIFKEPKVEFVKIQLTEMVTGVSIGGDQSIIAQCDGEVYNTEDCPAPGQIYN